MCPIDTFFKPQALLNPSTITTPPLIHPVDTVTMGSIPQTEASTEGPRICPRAIQLLQDLEAAAKQQQSM
jgi:hypothetical protein